MQHLPALFRVDGKVAVVTGAGRGLGEAIARLMAEAGAQVILADIDIEAAQRVAQAIAGDGGQAAALMVDIGQEAQVEVLFETVRRDYGRVDILVNNAASILKFDIATITVEQWDRLQSVNLRGTFLCMRRALTMMQAQGGGRIVNVSSIASMHPSVIGNACYGASKAGVNAITRAAALEFAPHGITVNAVLPGAMDTGEGGQIRAAGHPTPTGPATRPERYPLGRRGKPVELAAAVLFLASDAASFVNGHTLVVDGGFLVS